MRWSMLLAVPGFAILFLALLGGAVALGMLCAHFRDICSAIVSGLQFIFFLTPIDRPGEVGRSQARLRRRKSRRPFGAGLGANSGISAWTSR